MLFQQRVVDRDTREQITQITQQPQDLAWARESIRQLSRALDSPQGQALLHCEKNVSLRMSSRPAQLCLCCCFLKFQQHLGPQYSPSMNGGFFLPQGSERLSRDL